jgi:hypothetical protein
MSELMLHRPGEPVLVVERRGEQQLVYHGLVSGISMREELVGTHGEPAIEVVFVADGHKLTAYQPNMREWHPTLVVPGVVHISHRDWIEGRAGLAYEELPGALIGVCAYCRCTGRRPCAGGCSWLDEYHLVCSACKDKYLDDLVVVFPDGQQRKPALGVQP